MTLDNHPALQAIREDESDEECEQVQIFPEHEIFDDRLSKSLYYGRDTPSADRLSLPITELCVDYFNLAGFDTTLTGQSDLDVTKARLDRLDVARAAAVSRETCASPTSLVLALVYLERLRGSNPTYLHTVSSADLFLVSLLVASKLLHDDGEEDEVFNEEWANSAGMEKKELNRLEMEFLSNIEWNCHVAPKQFKKMTDRLEQSVIKRQIDRRQGGWTTYTDINTLSKHIDLQMIWERLANVALQVTAVCLAAYAASLVTMLGTCYALTKANLGPAAVSQSLNTLKSAVTTSSRTTMTPSSVRQDSTNSTVSDEQLPNLSHMSPANFEQLGADESDALSIASFVANTIKGNENGNNCQNDHFPTLYFSSCVDPQKKKPPYAMHDDVLPPRPDNENNPFFNMLPSVTNLGPNETSLKDGNYYCEYEKGEEYVNVMIDNKQLCSIMTLIRKTLTNTLDWKIDVDELHPFLITESQNDYVEHKSCLSDTCQNTWINDYNLFESSINQRNALFNHVGKAIIGL